MITLLNGPSDLRNGRTQARKVCVDSHVGEDRAEAAVLILSELVGNAVRHGLPPVRFETSLDRDDVLVTVDDGASLLPPQRALAAGAADESGRGLSLVSALSRSWGWAPTAGGKQVWARV
jgi:anti-sigma regulatory factor (Ser/Thr protein kinase)